MTCINCYYEFCWICMKKFEKGHYSLFNFSGCPGMEYGNFFNIDDNAIVAPPSEDECSWTLCLWKVACFFLAIIFGCLIVLFFCFFGLAYEFVVLYLNKNALSDDEHENQNNNANNNEREINHERNAFILNSNNNYSSNKQINTQNQQENTINNNILNIEKSKKAEDNGNQLDGQDYFLLILIISAGILLQPLYLMFYLMWGFMWFIKEYGWWCCLFDYSF